MSCDWELLPRLRDRHARARVALAREPAAAGEQFAPGADCDAEAPGDTPEERAPTMRSTRANGECLCTDE